MREDQVGRIKARSRMVEQQFDEFLKFLSETTDADGRGFDISKPIPETDSSVSDLRARSAAIAGLIRKFDDKGGSITPLADFASFTNAANAVVNAMKQFIEGIAQTKEANGGLQSIDYENTHFTWNNGQTISYQGQLKGLFDSTESYTSSFQALFQAINPSRAAFNFTAAANALSHVISRGTRSRDELQASISKAKSELDTVAARRTEFATMLEEVRSQHGLVNEKASEATEALATISARNDEATALGAKTLELSERVQAYEADFEGFQNQLSDMRSNYAESDRILAELISRFEKQAGSFDEMIEKSGQMLSSSTVAGLASEFGTIRTDLDTKLGDAHKAFNKSIIFLFASALPLILFVFAPFIVLLFPDNPNVIKAIAGTTSGQSGWHYFGQVIARFVILLPAIWYVTFCTARYNALFRLKEHYSYKYSMAVAVDGFKQQAPEYEGMIAALVFEQLAFNPVDKLGKKYDGPEDPPNPIAKLLLSRLRKAGEDA